MKLKETPNAGENMKQQELSFLASENTKWDSRFRRIGCFVKSNHTLPIQSNNCGPQYLPKGVKLMFNKKNLYMNI